MSRKINVPSPLPCPFCGGTKVRVGVESTQSACVACQSCGAKIAQYFPDHTPKHVWLDDVSFDVNHDRLVAFTAAKCVKLWNRRK